jgi:hypothetical protein
MTPAENELCCKLTSPQLQERKNTVITGIKLAITDKQEVQDGFVYTFAGTDQMLDQLLEFIKAERVCCPFFKFELTIKDPGGPVWLKITGPEGAKDFIIHELNL